MKFKLKSDYQLSGDQPEATENLTRGIEEGRKNQVLLGVTGSGKTFTIANVIEKTQRPTLVISHNKTLAGQLYQELRDFFPENAVSYFVSYYDYYQPEAYIPQTDTYIEKETEINEEIDKLRLAATTNLLTRPDTIVVASVSCIYNLGSPVEYGKFILELAKGVKVGIKQVMSRLSDLQYERSDFGFHRSTYRHRGDYLDLFPAYEDQALRIIFDEDKIQKMFYFDPVSGEKIKKNGEEEISTTVIYPAKHYMTDPKGYHDTFARIRADLEKREKELIAENKVFEAKRLRQRTEYDLEMIQEIGYVNGIENYSRYFDGRNPGDPPYTLLDYFSKDFLLVIDESHMTIPQIRGMYNGDASRKQTLIDYGFRLPSALDNRPLKFPEFLERIKQTIFVSATPSAWEIEITKEEDSKFGKSGVVEQLIRPTGLVDPAVEVRPTNNQIKDLINEIEERIKRQERVLITTLTKRMAEELSNYLEEKEIKVNYLHSDIVTLNRADILDKLRLGEYDVVVGINLLREGLDLPEVSLVALLDADKEGFLRSETSLIQTMGRAARHLNAKVIMYADKVTPSMERAINEVRRRRKIQEQYNIKNDIKPSAIKKPIRKRLIEEQEGEVQDRKKGNDLADYLLEKDLSQILAPDRKKLATKLSQEMKKAAADMDFELAAKIRDTIKLLKS